MTMATIRQWHSYIGLFIAPSVLFFAMTGSLQIFSLHEAHGDYRPPALIERLASVHKDQVLEPHHHNAPANPKAEPGAPPSDDAPAAGAQDDDKTAPATWLLKGFFLLVAICLAVSAALGLWIGLTQTRRKRVAWLLVIAGALIPVVLLSA
jgi:hypothetical protein